MNTIARATMVVTLFAASLAAQENKPVPKDSMRVSIPGCTKGQIFTVGTRTEDEPGSVDIPEGLHIRMNGPKQLISEIKAHEGSMIVITGIMKKGQYRPDGVGIGGGIRISPGPTSGGMSPAPVGNQAFIDVEGWRQIAGECRTK